MRNSWRCVNNSRACACIMDNGGSCYRGARIARRGATLETWHHSSAEPSPYYEPSDGPSFPALVSTLPPSAVTRLALQPQSHALPRLGDLGEGGRVRVMNVPKIGKLIVNVLVAGGRSAPAQRHSRTSDIIVNTDPHHKHLHLDVSIRTLHTY